jgi:16S rRNA (adenine1518-N6/adenine1519-N6)-dimethyltransferase
LQPLSEPPYDAGSGNQLDKVVAAALSMRRKTLRNSLRSLLDADQIESVGVDPGERAEQLSLEEFAALARLLPDDAN